MDCTKEMKGFSLVRNVGLSELSVVLHEHIHTKKVFFFFVHKMRFLVDKINLLYSESIVINMFVLFSDSI